jgi:hypothetical protein
MRKVKLGWQIGLSWACRYVTVALADKLKVDWQKRKRLADR